MGLIIDKIWGPMLHKTKNATGSIEESRTIAAGDTELIDVVTLGGTSDVIMVFPKEVTGVNEEGSIDWADLTWNTSSGVVSIYNPTSSSVNVKLTIEYKL